MVLTICCKRVIVMLMFGIYLIVLIPAFIIGIALQKIRHADVKQTNSYSDNNYIFWTKWVRGICKTLLTIGAVCSLIIGATIMGVLFNLIEGFAILVGIVVIAVGIFISITFFALIMMFSEISVNIYKLQNTGASSNSYAPNSEAPHSYGELDNSNNSWVCRCGMHNPNSAKFCPICGGEKQ